MKMKHRKQIRHFRRLLFFATLALFSCGKDATPPKDDSPDGPDDPPTEQTTVWESNSLHFAHLFGNVRSVDAMFDGVNTVLFDPDGYLASYRVSGYDAGNNPVNLSFRCSYDDERRLTAIAGDDLTIGFEYGDHGKYVEVEQDIFEYNELKYLYVFQPRFLKNLVCVTIAAGNRKLAFTCALDCDRMTMTDPDGATWSETTYRDAFPARRVTRYSGEEYKMDEEGNYVKVDGKYVKVSYEAVSTETFVFNTGNGNLLNYTDEVTKTYDDGTDASERSDIAYNDDRFNTIARQGSEVFTYDSFGDYTHIESGTLVSDFTYVRDEQDNWYDRIETTVLAGDTFTFRDQRTIVYY